MRRHPTPPHRSAQWCHGGMDGMEWHGINSMHTSAQPSFRESLRRPPKGHVQAQKSHRELEMWRRRTPCPSINTFPLLAARSRDSNLASVAPRMSRILDDLRCVTRSASAASGTMRPVAVSFTDGLAFSARVRSASSSIFQCIDVRCPHEPFSVPRTGLGSTTTASTTA